MGKVRASIEGALRLLGVVDAHAAMTADQAASGLVVLNEMLEGWTLESLMIYSEQATQWALTGGQRDYTLGPTGAWVGVRPDKINRANLLVDGVEYDLRVLHAQGWAEIDMKSLGGLPETIYSHGEFPNTTVSLWPVPSSGQYVVIYADAPLSDFASINDDLNLPPGYAKAIRFNLALEMASEYGIQPSPVVVKIAQDSKAVIKRLNAKAPLMKSDSAVNGGSRFGSLSAFLGGE